MADASASSAIAAAESTMSQSDVDRLFAEELDTLSDSQLAVSASSIC